MSLSPPATRVLLVDDDPADVALISRALVAGGVPLSLEVATSGEEALQRLSEELDTRPQLMVLDLNLPGMNGIDILKAVRADTALSCVPVIILTTSAEPSDVARAYDLGANGYITKPASLPKLESTLARMGAFWLQYARLPPSRKPVQDPHS